MTEDERIAILVRGLRDIRKMLVKIHYHISILSPMSAEQRDAEASIFAIDECLLKAGCIEMDPAEDERGATRML